MLIYCCKQSINIIILSALIIMLLFGSYLMTDARNQTKTTYETVAGGSNDYRKTPPCNCDDFIWDPS